MPFRGAPAWVSLLLVSLLTAIFALLVYRRFSNQQALSRIKDRIAASFFEIRLFNDDLRAILRAQLDLLRNNGIYLLLNLKPMAWMLLPMLILMTQLQFHYGYRGLKIGEPSVVTVQFAGPESPESEERPNAVLRSPPGLLIERGPIWVAAKQEEAWRLRPEQPGRYELELAFDDRVVTKTVVVSDRIERRSPVRHSGGFLQHLLYPAEEPIDPESGIVAIRIAYPDNSIELLGIDLHWIVWWLILTIILAFALRKRFGVTF